MTPIYPFTRFLYHEICALGLIERRRIQLKFGNMDIVNIGLGILGAVFFSAFGYMIRKIVAKKRLKSAEEKARTMLEEVKKEVANRRKEIDLEARDLLHKTRVEFEKESRDRKQELAVLERRLMQREENLERKVDKIGRASCRERV